MGGGVRHVPAGAGAVDALAGSGDGRDRLRVLAVDGHVDLVSARERVGAGAVGAAGGGGGDPAAGSAAGGAAGARDRAAVPVRPSRVELSPDRGGRRLVRIASARPVVAAGGRGGGSRPRVGG